MVLSFLYVVSFVSDHYCRSFVSFVNNDVVILA